MEGPDEDIEVVPFAVCTTAFVPVETEEETEDAGEGFLDGWRDEPGRRDGGGCCMLKTGA